ncbi:hypothetical protein HOLleu_21719 [Holothuria leucospilota]|uniref:Fibronectin type-III domain-containing protein n=1 Tax=Holothuria leucospilota TaxID=206669 RepID=A0A9Q1BXL6_HOLLE|nr:hypothetical protein HOLleu_21719 [Holothuria leucospilota]
MLQLAVEPVAPDPKRPMHYQTTLHDLWDNATYCVELFAENKYGQGDTEYFEFRTADKDAPTQRPNMGTPPTPAGQHNGEERQARTSVTISIITAIMIAGILQS